MTVIDGVTLVHMNPPKHSRVFGEYCESEPGEKLKRVPLSVNQLDLVFFDVYLEDSLKADTREGKGNAFRVSMKDSTPIYNDFKKFLRHNDSEAEFFLLIVDKVPKSTQNISITVVSTELSEVTSNLKK